MENYLEKMVADGILFEARRSFPDAQVWLFPGITTTDRFLTSISNKSHVPVCSQRRLTLWGARGLLPGSHPCVCITVRLSSSRCCRSRSAYYAPDAAPVGRGGGGNRKERGHVPPPLEFTSQCGASEEPAQPVLQADCIRGGWDEGGEALEGALSRFCASISEAHQHAQEVGPPFGEQRFGNL